MGHGSQHRAVTNAPGFVEAHQKTLDSEAGSARLLATPISRGTAAEVEHRILLGELLRMLSREERMICLWKKVGFSSQEIALHQQRTVMAIDTIFSRAKQKIRKALSIEDVTDGQVRRSC